MPDSKVIDYLSLYKDRRLFVIFGLGVISGFPWVLIGSAMTAWLQESGLTRTAIGFFGSVFAVYALNFLWAPLLDTAKLPWLNKLGRRRSWIILLQFCILGFVISISFVDPSQSIYITSALALGIAIASATQDTAIDAYRIEILPAREQLKIPAGAAMATSGWWAGYSLPGAVALILSDLPQFDWGKIYLVMAGFIALCIGFVLSIREPKIIKTGEASDNQLGSPQSKDWLYQTVVAPILEFFKRNGLKVATTLLLFLFLFKIGEAFLGKMSIVFYKEIGFSNTQIGIYSKLIGWWAIILFSIIASFINIHFGLVKGLLISGVAMASTNLMFSLMAWAGPVEWLFAVTVVVDQFTAAFATVASVSFISHLTSRMYTASQYALMASISNFGRTTLAAFSGLMVDALGGNWGLFFIITAVMVIPSLLLLFFIRHDIAEKTK